MRRAPRRGGMVLLVVTIVIMLLSLAAYQYVFSTETEHMAVALTGQRSQARQAALSTRDALSVMLELPRSERDALGGLADNPRCFGGDATWLLAGPLTGDPTMRSAAPPTISATATDASRSLGLLAHRFPLPAAARPADRRPALGSPGQAPGEPVLHYGAVNESAKLHLGKLLEWEQTAPGHGVLALLQLPGMTTATASAIVDWIDADDLAHPEGAETAFYEQLQRPIAPRQGLPPDLDELLFVRGVTPAALHGDPVAPPTGLPQFPGTNNLAPAPSRRSPTISQQSTQRGSVTPVNSVRPWRELLTVTSAERNEAYDGTPRIHLNQADLSELHAQLGNLFPAAWADFIVAYRQYGAAAAGTGSGTPPPLDLSQPAQFDILHPLDLVDARVQVPLDETRTAELASPWMSGDSRLATELPQLMDFVTVSSTPSVWGRINVNLAPAEVLATIPGMLPEVVDAIVTARERPITGDRPRTHPIWLWTEGVVDLPTLRLLLPSLTCGGDVFRADLWGNEDEKGPWFHAQTILDASGGATRSVYYRELAAPRNEITFPPIGLQNGLESATNATPRSLPDTPSRPRQRVRP